MEVQTFRAGSMREALMLVKTTLGPDASVLRTREVQGGVLRRIAGRAYVEITAAREFIPPKSQARRVPVVDRRLLRPSDRHGVDLVAIEAACEPDSRPHVTGPIRVRCGERKRIALVGPTGVGKTTTLAKLAAHFRFREGLRVGLVTVDTFRIGAIEQLRAYADIMDLPMEVVAEPDDLPRALARLADVDLVLMDTAGRGTRDAVKLDELRQLLVRMHADEIHLVVSATSSVAQVLEVAERFRGLGATAVILTKVDEVHDCDALHTVLRECHLPVSYLTTGQNVPDEIVVADARQLRRLLHGAEE
jgi:flagellar biosynthesis protein FlhF